MIGGIVNGRGEFTTRKCTTTVRFFDPRRRQWSIYFANAADGSLDLTPLAVSRTGVASFMRSRRLRVHGGW